MEHILVLRILYLCYITYSCISDLILVLRILYLDYGAYTCLTDHILVLQNLFLYIGSYTCITEHILVLRILYLCYGAYSCILDLILVLRSIYLYKSTRRYYTDSTCTKVLVGTTEQIQRSRRYIQIFTIFISLLLFFIQSLII